MKAHHVAAEKTFENLMTPGKNRKNVVSRKRRVVEKGDFDIGSCGSDVPGSKPKVVVMNPHSCPLRCFATGSFSESTIDFFKNAPISIVDVKVGWKSMKNWPERLF